MKQVKRDVPEGKSEIYNLKDIAFNSNDNIFLIFTHQKIIAKVKIPATKNKKKVNVIFDRTKEEELLICLNDNESRKLIKFLSKIEL